MTGKRYGTKAHNIRIPDPVWEAASLIASSQGTTVAAVVNGALARYVKRHSSELSAPPAKELP